MDEKRPENDFRVDNNIARTADNTFGLKEAAIANGGGGSLKDIAEAIKAIGSATKIKPTDLAADNAPPAGKIVAVKTGDSFAFADAASNEEAHLTITGNDLKNKLLLLAGEIRYNVPTYISDGESKIFDLRNNFATSPVILKIADELIPVQNLKVSGPAGSDIATVYADLNPITGFSILFSKDKDGKAFACFPGSAVPPAFFSYSEV